MTENAFQLYPVKTNKDVLIFEFADDNAIFVGCDSAGGTGPKSLDKIKVDGYTLENLRREWH